MSSQIYELFGFPVIDFDEKDASKKDKIVESRKKCLCPFMGQKCDGGGNRYQSFLQLRPKKDQELINFFGKGKDPIPAGVCSLKTSKNVWIVCPRRLFVLHKAEENNRKEGKNPTVHEKFCENLLRSFVSLDAFRRIGVWSEVKIKHSEKSEEAEDEKTFDYTFDYIICPTRSKSIKEASKILEMDEQKLKSHLEKNGYTLTRTNGQICIDDYPDGDPLIIEVMTSSTSGGNKAKGTTIQDAFKKAVLDKKHEAPGINYRQIWARMVSQLIVKSQIGKEWGGQTIWVLQDALTDYISKTTDLNLQKLISKALKEVNILSLRYADTPSSSSSILPLEVNELYAGQIPAIKDDTDFNKLLQAASVPPKSLLQAKLLSKKPRTFFNGHLE